MSERLNYRLKVRWLVICRSGNQPYISLTSTCRSIFDSTLPPKKGTGRKLGEAAMLHHQSVKNRSIIVKPNDFLNVFAKLT